MPDLTMNRDELERLGALLFGYGWKSTLADVLEINRKTVSRWIADDAVPAWAAERLRTMVTIAPPPGTTDADDRDAAWRKGGVMGQIMRPSDIRRAVSEWVAQGFAVTVQPDGTITITPPTQKPSGA